MKDLLVEAWLDVLLMLINASATETDIEDVARWIIFQMDQNQVDDATRMYVLTRGREMITSEVLL